MTPLPHHLLVLHSCTVKDCPRTSYQSHTVCRWHLAWQAIILGLLGLSVVGVVSWAVIYIAAQKVAE